MLFGHDVIIMQLMLYIVESVSRYFLGDRTIVGRYKKTVFQGMWRGRAPHACIDLACQIIITNIHSSRSSTMISS